jgi:hypothetical protein
MEKNTHVSQGRLKNGRFCKKRRHVENNNNTTEKVEEVEGRRIDIEVEGRRIIDLQFFTDQLDRGCLACKRLLTFRR